MAPIDAAELAREALDRAHHASVAGSSAARSGMISDEAKYVKSLLARAQSTALVWAHWEAINQLLGDLNVHKALDWAGISAGIGPVRMACARDAILGAFSLTDPDGPDRLTLCRLVKWLGTGDTAERLASRQWALDLGHKSVVADATATRNAARIDRLLRLVSPDWKSVPPCDPELANLREVLRPQRAQIAHSLTPDVIELPTIAEMRRFLRLTLDLSTDAAFVWIGSDISSDVVHDTAKKIADQFWKKAFEAPLRDLANSPAEDQS